MSALRLLISVSILLASSGASAEVYHSVPLSELKFAEGTLPAAPDAIVLGFSARHELTMDFMFPYVVCPDAGEAYFHAPSGNQYDLAGRINNLASGRICIRTTSDAPQSGLLFFPKSDGSGMVRLTFTTPPARKDQGLAKAEYWIAKRDHYRRLLSLNVPGSAWYRHELRVAEAALGATVPTEPVEDWRRIWMPGSRDAMLDETFSLFSGGRAVSENLQLDRQLQVTPATAETVALDSIPGITVRAYDWRALLSGATPETDALAQFIPEDQHALFFPSFAAMLSLMDTADKRATPLLYLLESRAEDAGTRARYERQLCLATDALSRLLGPQLVASVAFTGSDPYLRVGSDVAVLFEAKDAPALRAALLARHAASAGAYPAAKPVDGQVVGVAYKGLVSPDRAVSSYVATVTGAVVVTNSLAQLERILNTAVGSTKSLAAVDEYRYFRRRYAKSDPTETAFLVLSDATIRRWCGPRWRIGASRRTRAAAVLSELTAAHLPEMATGAAKEGPLPDEKVSGAGNLSMTSSGVSSSIYGNLAFMTPILELPLEKVTDEEARAYGRFRDNYQRNWRAYFDPIALRFSLSPGRDAFDLSVRPLIASSQYREFLEVVAGSTLSAGAGDPHPESIFHFVLSVSPEARQARQWSNMGTALVPELGSDAFGWFGDWLSLYLDDAPVWNELIESARDQENLFESMEAYLPRIPLALGLDAKNPVKLTLFLASLRSMVNQTAPGMTAWEPLKYRDQDYVKVSPSAQARADMDEDDPFRDFALYYAVLDRQLLATLDVDVLKRAIERSQARRAGRPSAATGWLGESAGLLAGARGLQVLRAVAHQEMLADWQRRAWSNTVALNEWRRRFGATHPIEFHERIWKVRLAEPAGEAYVWNEEFQCMESTRFGHPAAPRMVEELPDNLGDAKRLNLGLTFEEGGLRARGELSR